MPESAGRSTVASPVAGAIEDLMNRNGQLALGIWKFIGWQQQRIEERRPRSLLFRTTRERVLFLLADLLEHLSACATADAAEADDPPVAPGDCRT